MNARKRQNFIAFYVNEHGPYCRKCKVELTFDEPTAPDRATVQHIVPLCLGGAHSRSNLTVWCFACNNADSIKVRARKRARIAVDRINSRRPPRNRGDERLST